MSNILNMIISVQKESWVTCFGILQLTSTNIINELHVLDFFNCFTVNFDSLNLIHTNQCTFSYKDVLVFYASITQHNHIGSLIFLVNLNSVTSTRK